MEKRTIIAFALSFLVLLGWSYLTPKQQPVQPTEENQQEISQEQDQTSNQPGSSPQYIPASEETSRETLREIIPAATEKIIRIETPLYIVTFSSRGAAINSVMLKDYRQTTDADSLPVELVTIKDNIDDFFRATFEGQIASDNAKVIYEVDDNQIILTENSSPRDLTFRGIRNDNVQIEQTFRFYPDSYDIGLNITLNNRSQSTISGNIKTYLANQPPDKKGSYYSFTGLALLLNNELETLKTKKLDEEKLLSGKIEWVAYEDDYFISAVIPEKVEEGRFTGKAMDSGLVKASFIAPPVDLHPMSGSSSEFTLYMGPRDLDILTQQGKKLDRAIDYGFFDIIAKPLHYVLRFFYRHIHNYGIAIILLTVLIKIIFWPLTHKSYKSMKEMQKLQPLMAKIREKYKDDKQEMQRELMGLYKTYKVNPMGGCLPMVIQIPVFFALFRILGNSIELRHAPFFLWINDLSAPDRLFNFPFQIPFMSEPYGIPVLTLLMGASMFIQQKMTPTPGDPSQAKVMMFLPIIFTIMFINFPSGLVLYWLVNNILSIGQQYRIKRGPS